MTCKNFSASGTIQTQQWWQPEPQALPWHSRGTQCFVKPAANTRNPPVDGYRRPSNWSGADDSWLLTGPVSGRGNVNGIEVDIDGDALLWAPPATLSRATEQPVNVNALRMRILNNIRSEVLDVAMVLAEMQATCTTLGNNLIRLGRSLEAIHRRKPTHYLKLMHGVTPRDLRGKRLDTFNREVAGTYLEWKYGIMPTIYDIRGATEALDLNRKGSLFDNPPLLVARATIKDTTTFRGSFVGNIAYANVEGTGLITRRAEYKARCDYRVSGDGLRGLSRYGIGLSSVATVAWDKTPFTFVLDMAFPIADLIKAWTALAGVTVVGYCETSHVNAKASSVRLSGSYLVPFAGTADAGQVTRFVRTAFPAPPMPMPFVRNPIKTGNIATVLALFTQLRKKKP